MFLLRALVLLLFFLKILIFANMRAAKSDAAIVYSPLPSSQLKTQGMAAKLARAASPCTASFTLALFFFSFLLLSRASGSFFLFKVATRSNVAGSGYARTCVF